MRRKQTDNSHIKFALVLSMIGLPFLACGVIGLVSPEIVPALADPGVIGAMLGVGLTFDGAAVFMVMQQNHNADDE